MRKRFIRFNAVGLLGFVVQLTVLWALTRGGLHYLAATAIAVETALLHNYLWHERWTWRERDATNWTRLQRLGSFHMLNGVVSLVGNVALMRLLVGTGHVPPLAANLISVLACSLVNFWLGDRLVFSRRIDVSVDFERRNDAFRDDRGQPRSSDRGDGRSSDPGRFRRRRPEGRRSGAEFHAAGVGRQDLHAR